MWTQIREEFKLVKFRLLHNNGGDFAESQVGIMLINHFEAILSSKICFVLGLELYALVATSVREHVHIT